MSQNAIHVYSSMAPGRVTRAGESGLETQQLGRHFIFPSIYAAAIHCCPSSRRLPGSSFAEAPTLTLLTNGEVIARSKAP